MSRSKPPRARPESSSAARPAPRPSSRGVQQHLAAARRKRQFIAVGSVIASLVFALAIVFLNQPAPASPSDTDRRTIGKPEVPVLITEWSDFQ